jgi:cell division transport system permease protein
MRISTVGRHIREGGRNVVRNGWMSFASISAIAISLFILGAFYLLVLNVNKLADDVEGQVEIRVYLDVGLKQEQVDAIKFDIGSVPEVSLVEFISKEEGLEIVKEKFGEDHREILEGFEGDQNPLPDSFSVKVDEPQNVAFVAEKIEKLYEGQEPQPILDVQYGEGTVQTLFTITKAVRLIGLVLVAGLAFTAMFLISNTIKITIIARRREISIMKMVGATNSFIRWPFFIEGVLLGAIGSAIPIGILLYGYSWLLEQTQMELGLMLISLLSWDTVAPLMSGLLFGIGMIIGVFGSLISVRKFLKV